MTELENELVSIILQLKETIEAQNQEISSLRPYCFIAAALVQLLPQQEKERLFTLLHSGAQAPIDDEDLESTLSAAAFARAAQMVSESVSSGAEKNAPAPHLRLIRGSEKDDA